MALWINQLETSHFRAGVTWSQALMDQYDLSLLESIRLRRGLNKRAVGVYGRCEYPTADRPTYRIICNLSGPFPCAIPIRKPPAYIDEKGRYGPLPANCRTGVLCVDLRTGKRWYRVVGFTPLQSVDEGVVWIVAHELFHFLRRTRQIAGRNNEIQADAWADQTLERFRRGERA